MPSVEVVRDRAPRRLGGVAPVNGDAHAHSVIQRTRAIGFLLF
jgi:hypothetical protein